MEVLSRCKIRLRQRHPYFAVLTLFAVYRLDPEVALADTDGRIVRVNADALLALPDDVATGLLLHITLHAALLHPLRLHGRNPELWNIACDVIVNHIITTQTAFPAPPGSFVAAHVAEGFVPRTAEHVYEYLMKHRLSPDQVEGKRSAARSAGAGQGGDGATPASNAPEGALRADQTRKGGLSAAMAKRFGASAAPLQDQAAQKADSPAPAPVTAVPPPSAPLRDIRAPQDGSGNEALRVHWEAAVFTARDQASRQAGKDRSSWSRELDAACQPQIDWRAVLWRFTIHTPTDFAGLDNRFVHAGLYLESLQQETVNIDVAIDTSGSIGPDELEQFVSELRAIVASYPHIACRLFFCDTELVGPYMVTSDFKLPRVRGGGGTDFRPFFAALDRQRGERQIDAAIYFTDGEGPFPVTAPNYPVLWVALPGAIDDDCFPFGQVIRMA